MSDPSGTPFSAPFSRRRLMAAAGATGAVLAAESVLPSSLVSAMAAEAPEGGLDAIEHVVLLMQENRSFDHVFGSLRGVRGFGDRNVVAKRGGGTVFEQPDGAGTVLPYLARNASNRAGRSVQDLASLPHGWTDGQAANDHGWNDGWIAAKSRGTMATLDRQDVPFHYALADAFTVCDAYHCSVLSATSPNRNYWVSGHTGFEPNSTKRAVENDAYDEVHHAGYDWVTYVELLERHRVSWRVYQEWDNYEDNNIEFYRSFKAIMRKVLAGIKDPNDPTTTLITLDSFYSRVFGAATDADRKALLDALARGVATLTPAERSLYDRGLFRTKPGGIVEEFAADVAAGRLPKVSYIVPSSTDSEHPGGPSSPAVSASLTYRLLDAVASKPDLWRKTVFLINYDENDGYFDHVPPPLPPANVTDEFYDGKPIGLGVRVPMLVVSPWTVGGYVCSEVFDHSSTVQFLERWTGITAPDISTWRRTVAGDLTGAFDFSGRRRKVAIPVAPTAPALGDRWGAEPPVTQSLPPQEPATKRARPLPYQPDAFAAARGGTLAVSLRNSGRRPVHFQVFGYRGEADRPVQADVARRQEVTLPVVGSSYEVTVIGPNGFRREFTGAATDTLSVATRIEDDGVRIAIANTGGRAVTVSVTSLAHASFGRTLTVRPGVRVEVEVGTERARGWYDVQLTAAEVLGFRRRLAGHVENGRESITG